MKISCQDRRVLTVAFDLAPTLDHGERRSPPCRVGQLRFGGPAQGRKLISTHALQQRTLKRHAELKRQAQIGVAWLQRDHVRIDPGVGDANLAKKRRELGASFPAKGGENLVHQSDQPLGCGGGWIEVPGACIPLFENQPTTGLEQAPMRGYLFATTTERRDQETGMNEIEGPRLQLAVE